MLKTATCSLHSAGTPTQLFVIRAAFSPDGKWIVAASADKTARVWDAEMGHPLATLSGHTNGLARAAFSADGKRIVTASLDKTARVWDAENGHPRAILGGHTEQIYQAAFSPDGKRISVAFSSIPTAPTKSPVESVAFASREPQIGA